MLLNVNARMRVSSLARTRVATRVPVDKSNVVIRFPDPVRRALKIAMLVNGEYRPAIEPSSPVMIALDVNSPVAGFREIRVPMVELVVPYAHSVPDASTTHGELMMIPAGAAVDERLPGDAMVALAGCIGQSVAPNDVAVIKRISPSAIKNRRVGEFVMRDNSPLHTNSCHELSTADGIFEKQRGWTCPI